jgi:serine protease AprX
LEEKVQDVLNLSDEDCGDFNGHGTMMASIIVGSGNGSQHLYHGLATDAKLLDIKIFNHNGQATMGDLLLALDMILNRKPEQSPNILCFGFTTGFISNDSDPIMVYCSLLTQKNILLIAPMGNFGPDPMHINNILNEKSVIGAGSIDLEKKTAFFSGRITRENKFLDQFLLTPGVQIVAARAYNTNIGVRYEPNENYTVVSGTSVSCAVITGLFAILMEALHDVPLEEMKKRIFETSEILRNNQEISVGRIPNIKKILTQKNLYYVKPLKFKSLMKNAARISFLIMGLVVIFYYLIRILR